MKRPAENFISSVKYAMAFVLPLLVLFLSSCGKEYSMQPDAQTKKENMPVRVAVVTGGHDFDERNFLDLFENIRGIEYVHLRQNDDSEIFEDTQNWSYDVIVLYNMTRKISPAGQRNFIELLRNRGIGLVSVHHSIAAFQDWPEYRNIIGAKYYLAPTVENGVAYKRGEWKHDVNMKIKIADSAHPVTSRLSDFEIVDETYKYYVQQPGNRVLLTTDEPENEKELCWVRNYGKARVCYMQLGHDSKAYKNESYRQLLSGAILWCAAKSN